MIMCISLHFVLLFHFSSLEHDLTYTHAHNNNDDNIFLSFPFFFISLVLRVVLEDTDDGPAHVFSVVSHFCVREYLPRCLCLQEPPTHNEIQV